MLCNIGLLDTQAEFEGTNGMKHYQMIILRSLRGNLAMLSKAYKIERAVIHLIRYVNRSLRGTLLAESTVIFPKRRQDDIFSM